MEHKLCRRISRGTIQSKLLNVLYVHVNIFRRVPAFAVDNYNVFTFWWNTQTCSRGFIKQKFLNINTRVTVKKNSHIFCIFLYILQQIIELLLIHLEDSADIFLDVQIRSTADHLDNDMIFLIKSKLHIIHNIHIIHKSNTQVHWNYNCV